MFPRVTHPSATDILLCPFDLHVLSLPPAFALSQDQTLKLDLNFEPADHIVLTRSHHTWPTRSCDRTNLPSALHSANNDGVTFVSKRVPPKSFVRPQPSAPACAECFRSRPARTPPSTFLFLHLNLSNNPMHEASPSHKGEISSGTST